MKKKLLIIALACMILCFTACSARLPYDLQGTYSIEIHAYGNESAEPVAEFVVKGEDAERIVEMFSSLKLKEMNYTEPSIRGYVFWFRTENGDEIAKIELPYRKYPWIVVKGTPYQDVDSGIDTEYLAQLVDIASTAGPMER